MSESCLLSAVGVVVLEESGIPAVVQYRLSIIVMAIFHRLYIISALRFLMKSIPSIPDTLSPSRDEFLL